MSFVDKQVNHTPQKPNGNYYFKKKVYEYKKLYTHFQNKHTHNYKSFSVDKHIFLFFLKHTL